MQDFYRGMLALVQRLNDTSLSAAGRACAHAQARVALAGARHANILTRSFDLDLLGRSHVAAMQHNAAYPPHSVQCAMQGWLVGTSQYTLCSKSHAQTCT